MLASPIALLHHPARLGLAGVRPAGLYPQPRPPRPAGPEHERVLPGADLPPARADPHPLGQRQVAQRDRPLQPAVDAPGRRRAPGREDGRPGAREHRDRLLRALRLGDGGAAAGRRGLLAPHGPLALAEGSGGDRWSTGVVDLERTGPGRWLMRLTEGGRHRQVRHPRARGAGADPSGPGRRPLLRALWCRAGLHRCRGAGLRGCGFVRLKRGIDRQEVSFSPTVGLVVAAVLTIVGLLLAVYLLVSG